MIIKPADKNLGLTLMNRTWYDMEINRQLADTNTYRPVKFYDIPIIPVYESIKFLAFQASEQKLITPQQYIFIRDKVIPSKAEVPQIYILPKVHKEPLKGRPIVPGFGWITTPASILVDHILQPLLKQIPTVIADSKSLLIEIEKTKFPNDATLVTADVSSLYTEIDIKLGIAYVRKLMRERSDVNFSEENDKIPLFSVPLIEFTINLLSIVMHNNYFRFGDNYYLQIKGTAMGTPAAVVFANLFMYGLERNVLNRYLDSIYFYKRFLDDIIIINKPEIEEPLQASLQSMNKNIRLEFSDSPNEATFLDLIIFKGSRFKKSNILDTKVHQKALNAYLYIPFNSFHRLSTKTGFIKTELQRYVRNSSSFDEYLKIKKLFWPRLRARGYPPAILTKTFSTVWYKDRSKFLVNKPKEPEKEGVFFTTELTPLSARIPIKRILNTHLPQLLPRIGFRKTPNLANIFCRNRIFTSKRSLRMPNGILRLTSSVKPATSTTTPQ